MSSRLSALLLALPLAAACGDNHGGPDALVNSDAAGSGHDAAIVDGGVAPVAMAVAGDFTVGDPGVLAQLAISGLAISPGLAPTGAVGDDPMLRHFGHELFIVNRSDGNNVTILDDATFTVTEQLATGAGSNPQDVAVVGSKLYVPVFAGKGVVVVTRGTDAQKVIDLSADDPDGKPNCASAIAVGTDVYVACELLDNTNVNLPPRGLGKVYVIDATTDTLRTKFTLQQKNPFGLLEATGDGNVMLSGVDFATGGGCVEKITVGTTPTSACVATNAALGGFASRLQAQTPTLLWAAVPNSSFTGQALVSVDLSAAPPTVTTWSPGTQSIGDVALCPDGTRVVSDVKSGAAGLRAYGATHELTTSALPIGLPPSAQHGIECY